LLRGMVPIQPNPLEGMLGTHCPCGAKALYLLTPVRRQRCTDPIPVCGGVCGRPLPCASLPAPDALRVRLVPPFSRLKKSHHRHAVSKDCGPPLHPCPNQRCPRLFSTPAGRRLRRVRPTLGPAQVPRRMPPRPLPAMRQVPDRPLPLRRHLPKGPIRLINPTDSTQSAI